MPNKSFDPRIAYQPVDIRIFASVTPDEYPVELSVPGWRDFERVAARLDPAHLLTIAADPQAYGLALGQGLFADSALGPAYRETQAAFQARKQGLRIRIRLDPDELHALHWERIFHPFSGGWYPLGVTADTPFSRHVFIKDFKRAEPETARPLKVLAIIASPPEQNPYNLVPIPLEQRQRLHRTLDGLPSVRITYLETGSTTPPTLEQIRPQLAQGYHIVHFLCHGAITPGGTVLYLESESGDVKPVEKSDLVSAFTALAQKPLLCFLAACETAAGGRHDAFVPLGPALVEGGGVHAVVAMSDRVGMVTASTFTSQFYTRLVAHGAVDLAVNEARAQIRDQWDWGVPVLFMRLLDGQLFTRRKVIILPSFTTYILIVVIAAMALFFYIEITPPKPMRSDFNIALTKFGEIDDRGNISFWEKGDVVRESILANLQNELEAIPRIKGIVEMRLTTNLVQGATTDQRRQAVQAIALKDNAHLVVYGNLQTREGKSTFVPEFYITNLKGAEELIGSTQLGTPITIGSITVGSIGPTLTARTEALVLFTIGLIFLNDGDRDNAVTWFSRAKVVEGWKDEEGKEVLYLFLGTAYYLRDRNNDLAQAFEAYSKATGLNPEYARAYLGLGNVYLREYERSGQQGETKLDHAIIEYEKASNAKVKPMTAYTEAKIHYSLGNAYLVKAQGGQPELFSKAESQFQQVTNDYEQGNDQLRALAAQAYFGLGVVHDLWTQNYQLAADFYRKSIGIASAIEDKDLQRRVETRLKYIESELKTATPP
ncbi:MAG: CHAT domain-containing protein [Chloroflexi bacterium]|nr:CHAT domain-containing protein [Chloroflexota bacterium]